MTRIPVQHTMPPKPLSVGLGELAVAAGVVGATHCRSGSAASIRRFVTCPVRRNCLILPPCSPRWHCAGRRPVDLPAHGLPSSEGRRNTKRQNEFGRIRARQPWYSGGRTSRTAQGSTHTADG